MDLYIYSDESDVFDKVHNDIFVFGGLICLGTTEREGQENTRHYLDYACKIAVKEAFKAMISSGAIIPEEADNLCFYADEHTTAANGLYELREGLEQEFKRGTYNQK